MIRTLEELSPLEKLALIDMSYSRLDTFSMCEAKYYYTYVTKDERVFGPAATLGNIVHSVLEKADFSDLKLVPLQESFIAESVEWDPEDLIPQDLYDVGSTILTEFVDRHSGDQIEVLHREMYFEGVVGGALFRGYIDRVDRTPEGGLHIVDYKTGKYQVAQKWVHQNLQLGLYALFVHKLYPDLWPIRGDLYYLRSGKMIGHTYTEEDLEWVENKVVERVNEVVNNNSFSYTPNTRNCGFCDYRKTGVCPGGKRYRY